MFGQPAASHTVFSPAFRTRRFRSINSGPILALTRIHSGRFALTSSAMPSTPAWANRPINRTGELRPSACARLNALRSLSVERSVTSARSMDWASNTRPNVATTRSTTSLIGGTFEPKSRAIDVTPLSAIPHGTMWLNIARSGSTFSAKP